MHKDKNKSMFVIKIGSVDPLSSPKKEETGIDKEKEVEKTESAYGGYTPKELISKLEEIKESIAKSDTREALMKLDNCIVRLSKKGMPSSEKDAFTTLDYELDRIMPNQGKS